MKSLDRLGLKGNSSKVTFKAYNKGIQAEQDKIQTVKFI